MASGMPTPDPLESGPLRSGPLRLARPALDQRELAAIGAVLESGMLVSGAVVERFEHAARARCGRAHAVAVGSGTAALELAMRALDLAGGEVLVPALTWPSPAHAAALVGARPVLCDVDPDEWNGSPHTFGAALRAETRGVVAIDQLGVPARHGELEALLRERGRADVVVIEDAACAIGSSLGGRPCGSFGAVSTLSFHPRKVITTGEGGMCLTDDAALAARLRALRNHGQSAPGVFVAAGPNHRLTELQAAMGLVQLEKLDAIVARRRAIAARYREAFATRARAAEGGLALQACPEGATRNEQTFGAILPPGASSAQRDRAIAIAAEHGVELGRLSYDLTALPSLAAQGPHAPAPVTAGLVARGLALPLHTLLTDDDVERVVAVVGLAVERALAEPTP
jgi:perosamine synthetase